MRKARIRKFLRKLNFFVRISQFLPNYQEKLMEEQNLSFRCKLNMRILERVALNNPFRSQVQKMQLVFS